MGKGEVAGSKHMRKAKDPCLVAFSSSELT